MAKNIKINDVTYNSVDSISIPLAAGGGNAVFPETSDANAAAGDIASGKTAYVNGSKITGTATGGGGTPAAPVPKDVNFYDFDSTLVAGYTIAEAQALAALPDAPDLSGYVEPFTGDTIPLSFQGWNYTLAQVNATTGPLNVGAMRIPTDGKTHFVLRVTAETGYDVPLYYRKSNTSTLVIDWGDGTQTTDSTSGNRSQTHTFTAGTYHCTMLISSGSGTWSPGQGSSSTVFVGADMQAYRNCLFGCYFGNGVTSISNDAFYYCRSLTSITIPSGVTSIGSYAFQGCYSLTSITIPSGVTSIGASAFQYCYSLTSITIPSSVTSISNNTFYYCYILTSITIPSGVTSIGAYAFRDCYSIKDHYIYATTPPSLASTNAFTGINTATLIHVPAASLAAYQEATNWATYASYMVGDL